MCWKTYINGDNNFLLALTPFIFNLLPAVRYLVSDLSIKVILITIVKYTAESSSYFFVWKLAHKINIYFYGFWHHIVLSLQCVALRKNIINCIKVETPPFEWIIITTIIQHLIIITRVYIWQVKFRLFQTSWAVHAKEKDTSKKRAKIQHFRNL